MKTYVGYRTAAAPGGRGAAVVTVLEPGKPPRPLGLRLDLAAHSPAGPEWGYAGSGPAQLALALAADVLGDDARAVAVHQRLKRELVAGLAAGGWTLTDRQVWDVIVAVEASDRDPTRRAIGGCGDCE